ncbi:MAG TPA: serine/threonine-protein kinase [Ktedonobacteraceae bacterium]|nr:serine/threonine-protein kinase [Ktedonobacteraceae bacterium]
MEKRHHYSGKTLGNYHLMDELAGGAFGKLFLASSSSSPEQNAVVKFLHSTSISTQQEQEQFLQEAHALQQLRHPHILPILDVGIDENIPYIVTEYAPHGSLYTRLHSSSTTSLARAEILTIIAQVGQALLYAHRHNIIHGNLKPQNILFNSEGHAVLADFAFSTLPITPRDSSYTAPEQLIGAGSKESDQYALGCIIYEMFAGKAPFSLKATGTAAESRPRSTLAQLKARLPQDLSLIILKAIAREPMQRYSGLEDFLNALGMLTIIDSKASDPEDGLYSVEHAASTQLEGSPITPIIASSSPSFHKKAQEANEVGIQTPDLELSARTKTSGTSHTSQEQSRTGRNKFRAISQPRSIKEWPLIVIAVAIIMLSILGTLAFGGLSISASQANPDLTGTSTAHILTPTQSTLPTPTVVVTSTAVQPPMGQRVKSNPTPTPTPTFTPTPTPPIAFGSLSLNPSSFSPANCASANDHFECIATLSLGNGARNAIVWYATSRNTDTTFNPGGGFLSPGQSVQITIDIPRNCPGNSALSFHTSRGTFTVPWSC